MKNRFAEAGIAEGADPWLSLDEAADYLNVRPGWLSERVQARRIKYTRMGKFLRFRRSDLDAYLEALSVESVLPEPVVRRRSVPVRKRSAAAGGRDLGAEARAAQHVQGHAHHRGDAGRGRRGGPGRNHPEEPQTSDGHLGAVAVRRARRPPARVHGRRHRTRRPGIHHAQRRTRGSVAIHPRRVPARSPCRPITGQARTAVPRPAAYGREFDARGAGSPTQVHRRSTRPRRRSDDDEQVWTPNCQRGRVRSSGHGECLSD